MVQNGTKNRGSIPSIKKPGVLVNQALPTLKTNVR